MARNRWPWLAVNMAMALVASRVIGTFEATIAQLVPLAALMPIVAIGELAHSVHVEVDGLRPGRDYFYQFDARGEESPVGHFRTAPRRRTR